MSELHSAGKYSHPSPYPEIKVVSPNLYYAEILMDDYAGVVSEVTAINQYFFHHVILKEVSKELGELLEDIAITEMHHMEMLAETIRKLGGTPIIRGSYSTWCNYWNGSFIYYGEHICDRITANINAEIAAINNYRQHAQMIDDPYIKAILERIILDEELHLKHFNKALDTHNCK